MAVGLALICTMMRMPHANVQTSRLRALWWRVSILIDFPSLPARLCLLLLLLPLGLRSTWRAAWRGTCEFHIRVIAKAQRRGHPQLMRACLVPQRIPSIFRRIQRKIGGIKEKMREMRYSRADALQSTAVTQRM